MSLTAQTNDSVDIFYKPTWQRAWSYTGNAYLNSKGHISFPKDDVVLARFEVFNWWFMPSPHKNRFHDVMLECESKVEYFKFEAKLAKRRNRKMFYIGAGTGFCIIFVPALIIKILQ